MATKHQLCSISILSLIILTLFAAGDVEAQSPPNENNNSNNPNYFTSAKFNPSMAVIIVVLISAFFFLGFFSIYIRQCGGERMNSITASAAAAVGARSRRQRGLDSTILEKFPTLVYSEVKEHKVGKGALECAICLNEFEDEDTIRLLPKCDHVFHQECIDAWLVTHVTCPVCRTNYAEGGIEAPATATAPVEVGQAQDAAPAPAEQVVIAVEDGERKEEMKELARIASRVRRNGSRRGRNLPRSHSTGHSMALKEGGLERYTLRLPENIRKDILASGMMQRERSCSRVIGEESSRRGRSGRLGRSDRWSSLLVRSLSAKIPAWGNWKRGEEGSVKEGSVRGKFAGGGGGGFFKKNSDDDSESSAAGLNRV